MTWLWVYRHHPWISFSGLESKTTKYFIKTYTKWVILFQHNVSISQDCQRQKVDNDRNLPSIGKGFTDYQPKWKRYCILTTTGSLCSLIMSLVRNVKQRPGCCRTWGQEIIVNSGNFTKKQTHKLMERFLSANSTGVEICRVITHFVIPA